MLTPKDARICVLGLGYVGLPLAVAFGAVHDTLGYDLDAGRIAELRRGEDRTLEVEPEELAASGLRFSHDEADLADRNVFIVTVPTPIDSARRPDLGAISAASRMIGRHLKPGAVVIYESTVYPGCTEEICVPILEQVSGLTFNRDFFCGYSPERANPGDRQHRLSTITKVTAGSTTGSRRPGRQSLPRDCPRRHPSGQLDQGGRGGQGDRKHPARPEHRPDQ
jgi:UDP-N-acetyl-D-galactosamine dehydrogenase